jgi:hypothetical protein
MPINWKQIAEQIGGLETDGRERIVGTEGGRKALELLLGEESLRDSVDYWVDDQPGCFTAEMVLKIARPLAAMERCYEIFQSATTVERRCAAVFLLSCFADHKAMPWIPYFLSDPDKTIRWNGLYVLRYILYDPVGDDSIALAKKSLLTAESDPDPDIRKLASDIRAQLEKHEHTT